MRRVVLVLAVVMAPAMAATACSSSGPAVTAKTTAIAPSTTVATSPSSSVPTTSTGSASAPEGTAPATTAASTTTATTAVITTSTSKVTTPAATAAATTTTARCPNRGSTAPVNVGFPGTMSSLVGKTIRTGAQSCSERIVIELQAAVGGGSPAVFPGYRVQYESNVVLDPSGLPVTIRGHAFLVVSLGSWMREPGGTGYQGPTDIVPTNVRAIKEMRLIEDFEGQHSWAIGLDTKRNVSVSTLSGPPRLVIDIQTG